MGCFVCLKSGIPLSLQDIKFVFLNNKINDLNDDMTRTKFIRIL